MSLRPAIVGLGQVAWRFDEEPGRTKIWTHAGAYQAAGYEPPVAYDPDETARAAFVSRYPGARAFDSLDAVVDAAPDVVSVCTPNDRHAETVAAVLAGTPRAIWCEKPLATDLDDARRVVTACGERNIPLFVSHVRRWVPAWQRLKTRLNSGEIGAPLSIRVAMPNRLWSVGSHAVDLLTWLGGPVTSLRRFDIPELHEGGEPARAALLAFASGATGYLQVTGRKANLVVEVEVIGEDGRLTMSERDMVVRLERFETSDRFDGYRELGAAAVDCAATAEDLSPFTAIAKEIALQVSSGTGTPTCSGADALGVQEILSALAENDNAEMQVAI